MKKKNNSKKDYTEEEKILNEAEEKETEDTLCDKADSEDETPKTDTETSKPKKKTRKKVLLGILIAILLVISGLCIRYWHVVRLVVNWENISAYINSQRYSRKELEQKMAENNSKMEKIVKENSNINLRSKPQLTEEESKALESGLITYADAIRLVMDEITLEELIGSSEEAAKDKETEPSVGEQTSENSELSGNSAPNKDTEASSSDVSQKPGKAPSGNTSSKDSTVSSDKVTASNRDNDKNTTSSSGQSSNNSTGKKPDASKPASKPETETKDPEPKDKVSEIVAELYVIQADFMARLEAIGDQAYAEYKASHYDRSKVMTIVDGYTATVGALESECDKKVNSLIKELNAELDKVGGDKALSKEIKNYYYTEKSLKKSYYLDRLNDEDYK